MELSMSPMACIVASFIAIRIVYLIHKHKPKTVSRAHLPLPPGPAGPPLVGTALHFIGPFSRSPHAVLTRLAKTYGPIMSFRPGMAGSFVVVSSPDAAREALVKNDAALAARFVPDVAQALAHSSESVFFLPNSSALWKRHRAMIGGHLSAGRSLDTTRHVRDRHARRLAENALQEMSRFLTKC